MVEKSEARKNAELELFHKLGGDAKDEKKKADAKKRAETFIALVEEEAGNPYSKAESTESIALATKKEGVRKNAQLSAVVNYVASRRAEFGLKPEDSLTPEQAMTAIETKYKDNPDEKKKINDAIQKEATEVAEKYHKSELEREAKRRDGKVTMMIKTIAGTGGKGDDIDAAGISEVVSAGGGILSAFSSGGIMGMIQGVASLGAALMKNFSGLAENVQAYFMSGDKKKYKTHDEALAAIREQKGIERLSNLLSKGDKHAAEEVKLDMQQRLDNLRSEAGKGGAGGSYLATETAPSKDPAAIKAAADEAKRKEDEAKRKEGAPPKQGETMPKGMPVAPLPTGSTPAGPGGVTPPGP